MTSRLTAKLNSLLSLRSIESAHPAWHACPALQCQPPLRMGGWSKATCTLWDSCERVAGGLVHPCTSLLYQPADRLACTFISATNLPPIGAGCHQRGDARLGHQCDHYALSYWLCHRASSLPNHRTRLPGRDRQRSPLADARTGELSRMCAFRDLAPQEDRFSASRSERRRLPNHCRLAVCQMRWSLVWEAAPTPSACSIHSSTTKK